MWYFTWILGLLLACSLGIINVLRLEAQEALAKESLPLDPLTQLFTKTSIWQRLREKVENSRRNHAPFSLIFISLKTFMHQHTLSVHEHDAVVRDVVAVFKKQLRQGLDLAARVDGDSFLLILTGLPLATAENIARNIQAAVLNGVKATDQSAVAVAIQTGVVEYNAHATKHGIEQDVEQLVSLAQQKCV